MLRFLSLIVVATNSAVPGVIATPSPAAKPKWVLDYAPNSCSLTRARSGLAGGLRIETRPFEIEHQVQFLLPKIGQRKFTKIGRLSVADSRPPVDNYISVEEPRDSADRVVDSFVSNEQLSLAVRAQTLGVIIPGRLDEKVSTVGLGKALVAVRACEESLAAKWGTPKVWTSDPTPHADPRTVFQASDYPADMVSLNIQGDVRLLVKIGVSGEALACRSIDRAEFKAFGEVACAVIHKRVKFSPARTAAGDAVESFYVTPSIRFRLAG
ncbi:energy transducer TonB [Sphingomonas sp.]|uniref:energy transducer TonB n=1 Tax=Sphingomonas sp. TaxID=28214 RepID=UPI00286B25E5|nr:energy transducer TonB [Sphingomonas sp.]